MAPLKIGFNARELKQHGVLERMKAGKLNQLEAAGKLSPTYAPQTRWAAEP